MFAGIKRAFAIALLAAPIPAFAETMAPAPDPSPARVTFMAGQGGFMVVPIVQNERTYALTGVNAANRQVTYFRAGQGNVMIPLGR